MGGMGYRPTKEDYTVSPTFHIMLESKSLQQLAMKTIYDKQDALPYKHLPTKLIAQLGLCENGVGLSYSV